MLVGFKTTRALREKSVWIRPEIIKVNVDASYYQQDGYGSTGVVLRDHIEAMVQAQAIWYRFAQNAGTMEALALRGGIHVALGHLKVIIESDAQHVVRMLNEANFSRADLTYICYEI